jgi:hypothetical protein
VLSVALVAWALRGWLAAWSMHETLPAGAIERTVVAGALLVPPAWETNALVLLIPLTKVLVRLTGKARTWYVAGCAALSVALAPLPLFIPWRSGAVTIGAYVLFWAVANRWADRSGRAAGAA